MPLEISLADRGVVGIAGADAAPFLHNLVTNDILSLAPGEARFAALLTPQGKLLFDFLVFAQDAPEGRRLLIDAPRALAPDLIRRLGMYKLRAQVTIADRSAELACFAVLDSDSRPNIPALALARDPRSEALGWRGVTDGPAAFPGDRAAYDRRRIAAGAPEGGVDFPYGDAYPHDADMDLLNGVDFSKGCYIGQEVVSRMKHRGAVRKRVIRYVAKGGPAPAPGTPIRAGETEIGVAGSRAGAEGLALVRLDRLASALAAGQPVSAGEVSLDFPKSDGP